MNVPIFLSPTKTSASREDRSHSRARAWPGLGGACDHASTQTDVVHGCVHCVIALKDNAKRRERQSSRLQAEYPRFVLLQSCFWVTEHPLQAFNAPFKGFH